MKETRSYMECYRTPVDQLEGKGLQKALFMYWCFNPKTWLMLAVIVWLVIR